MEIKFIYVDSDDAPNEIEELLDKGLIKYFYGKDIGEPEFVFLAKNENIIKDTLTSEYRILNIIEEISIIFENMYITVEKIWENKAYISSDKIIDLIDDDLYGYISEHKQKEIFNSENPFNKLKTIFNKIGREQLKIEIKELLTEVDNAEFI
ncbi:TPA: hypothetical protein PTV74_003285 [Clostridium botulinum]|nr:hypothetical protein [Clostridium botulinum]HDK7206439.1 hypothetical protein [Clostridium botulinum]HDK7210175.1 hypothetical protein [Clostridium botulinum]HDK7265624.1 hypothetical protein [Clostridium botulinum]HDK7269472.1 hypothetical protein [Clostridium botulinum]